MSSKNKKPSASPSSDSNSETEDKTTPSSDSSASSELRNQIKASATKKEESDPEYQQALGSAERKRVEIDGLKRFYSLRDQWSWAIIAWISIFIIFHVSITALVGSGSLDFTTHQWLLPAIITENFLQIIGMGYVIVKFLYPDTKPK